MPQSGKLQIDGFGYFSARENFSRRNGDALFSALPIPAGGFPTIANRRRHIDEARKIFRVFGGYSELAVARLLPPFHRRGRANGQRTKEEQSV